MGKTNTAKTLPDDFKVTTLEILLLSQQAITSKGIPVPYTNLQLNLYPIPNWTCSVVTISPFDARHSACADNSTRLQSPTREGCWLQSSSVHPNDEDPENAWSQNPTVQKLHRVILRLALLKFHYYHDKQLQVKKSQYLIPTYN